MRFDQVWNGRNCDKNPTEWFPASVPGNIQYDYSVFHKFEDLNYSDNYRQFIPLEDDHWEYQAVLNYDKKEGEHVFFVSGGIDYKYDVIINGEKIYSYEGMFRGFELDLTENLNGKEDLLTVHIYPHPKTTGGRPNTRDEVDQSCKPPLSYGWDFNPRLLNSGMWEEAYIETRGVSYIGDVEVLAKLSEDLKIGTVTFDFTCELPCETALYDMEGNLVYQGTDRKITVEDPNEYTFVGAEIEKTVDGNTGLVFDGDRYKLWSREEGGDGVYHVYDKTAYPETNGYGPALFAYISEPCRFIDSSLNTVEMRGNKALTVSEGTENYKLFIEGFAALLVDPPGDNGPYFCVTNCPCRLENTCESMGGGDGSVGACTDACTKCHVDCRRCPAEAMGQPGYADYCNSDGVMYVTQELKDFLQKYSLNQRLFMDGDGWVEESDIFASEDDQWLFACGYYEKK